MVNKGRGKLDQRLRHYRSDKASFETNIQLRLPSRRKQTIPEVPDNFLLEFVKKTKQLTETGDLFKFYQTST